ncbi:MAG: hypothetical protein OXG44_12695 [Gammaproteobacteria bacterium]|nr:hypothetical protein [Gammaproteobacteria bacterium]
MFEIRERCIGEFVIDDAWHPAICKPGLLSKMSEAYAEEIERDMFVAPNAVQVIE